VNEQSQSFLGEDIMLLPLLSAVSFLLLARNVINVEKVRREEVGKGQKHGEELKRGEKS
jgi:hypothetical protein